MAEKQLRVGLVGLGMMGAVHWSAWQDVAAAEVVAVADIDPEKLKNKPPVAGAGPVQAANAIPYDSLNCYQNTADMLANQQLDLVDVCVPTHCHAEVSVLALEAGVHVIVEKPVAYRPEDAQAMLAAEQRSPGSLFVAQVVRCFPEYQYLVQRYRDNTWGRLLSLHMRRLVALPQWSSDCWYHNPNWSGGAGFDLHIHDTDFVVHMLGKPQRVFAQGIAAPEHTARFLATTYDYGEQAPVVTAEGGWVLDPGFGFQQAYDACFEGATLQFDSLTGRFCQSVGGQVSTPEYTPDNGYRIELELVAQALLQANPNCQLTAASAVEALRVCHAEHTALYQKNPVQVS